MALCAAPVKAACGTGRAGRIGCAMKDSTSDPRKQRLAEALRANLRRRKAQERAQSGGNGIAEDRPRDRKVDKGDD